MGIYETPLGYQVKETLSGLDVTENGEFVCELGGKCLNDFRVGDEDTDIDDDKLENAIEEQIGVQEFLDYQAEYC